MTVICGLAAIVAAIMAAIVAGLVVLVIAFNAFWRIVEAVHPFTYRQVLPREIHGHVCDLFNRGLNRSKMLITCEQSGRQLFFRKTYNRGQPGMAFRLIVPVAPSMESELSQAIAAIGVLKLPWNLRRRWGTVSALDVDCLGSVDKAYEAADVLLAGLCCAPDTSTFSVRLKGRHLGVDGHVGGETTVREIKAMLRYAGIVGQRARPYSWWAYYCMGGTWAKSLGMAVGRIAAWVFPPRNRDRL